MAAVLDVPGASDPAPGQNRVAEHPVSTDLLHLVAAQPEPAAPVPAGAGTGLRPIQRLTSDERIARIIPQSDSRTVLSYSSRFARDFIRSDYNFCAAKVTVARNGKLRALDTAFRETGEWLAKAITWVEKSNAPTFPMVHEQIELLITHPLAGRLVRSLSQYDRLFVGTMCAVMAVKLQPEERANILANAEKRIQHIVQVCIPDNDQYDFDGTRRES